MNKIVLDPANKHAPCHMTERPHRFTRQGGRNSRKWAVWYTGYDCPLCGASASRPCNPFRGRKVPPPVCDGVTYKAGRPVKRPARIEPVTDGPPPATPGTTPADAS